MVAESARSRRERDISLVLVISTRPLIFSGDTRCPLTNERLPLDKQVVLLGELKKALARLREALALPKDDVVRDSVIQRFEFTVELSWKVLHRFLKNSGLSESLTPKATFREAARFGYVSEPEAWIEFVDQRNLSSHAYREDLAEEVYASAVKLPDFVDKLINALERDSS